MQIPEHFKLKIAFITVTFNTKDSHPVQWVLLALTAGILNILIWPFIVITSVNAVFGTHLDWFTWPTFLGTWGLLATIDHFSTKE